MTHSSLEAVMEIFSSSLGIHRINVVNNQGRVEGILSKTDIVRFLLSKLDLFKEASNKTLLESGLGKCPVVTIPSIYLFICCCLIIQAAPRSSMHWKG